ncbi:hypothetical protein FA15DRAFT_722311 [Coprinopsis marcescibilis]|uniref:Six-hairpin glycosidase n=1 Tax=Coprinopsis marcescibilis TaxID=230819 RepID=A0A5C3KIT6_COPMA|nr:hypothetical protein FA15DRAFT_722311 [Coprinopsis marcescibilis]
MYIIIQLTSTSSQASSPSSSKIPRRAIISHFNPRRTSSSPNPPQPQTPLPIGNGNLAFNTDLTSLQTLHPHSILSSWSFKPDAPPPNRSLSDIAAYTGQRWPDQSGRLIQYDFGGPPDLEAYLRGSPNRANLARVGLLLLHTDTDADGKPKALDIEEAHILDAEQVLDLWTGRLSSGFTLHGHKIHITSTSSLTSDTISIRLSSPLLDRPQSLTTTLTLGLFIDFPWNEGSEKFQVPFVGYWDVPHKHSTTLTYPSTHTARIAHTQHETTFYTYINSPSPLNITRDSPLRHRYTILSSLSHSSASSPRGELALTLHWTPKSTPPNLSSPDDVERSSTNGWFKYWSDSGFVDVWTGSEDPRAEELQRRIILSRYLLRVNGAGDTPPQESGLVNNGWFGKFHMEMYFWHSAHWALWNNWEILNLSSTIYHRLLPSARALARTQQGYTTGARWLKMTDPSGRSSPGELNNLLIWQQPHPILFALYEYRAFPTSRTLKKWREVILHTADWMAEFAWFNSTSGKFDLGPPVHVVSEDTSPNRTVNPAFELAYWRYGLGEAERWVEKLGERPPEKWKVVRENLAALPVGGDGLYAIHEGIHSSFWTDPAYTSDHPALVGLHGWLPPTPGLDLPIAKLTSEKIWTHWNITNCWGWDFPMLAMSAARNGDPEKALEWLLHPLFAFDDVGMPLGGARVPTPYFPASGSLLYAIAMMAKGWDGSSRRESPGFPRKGWKVRTEGLSVAL